MFIKELEIEQTCNEGKDIFIKIFIGSESLTVRQRERERERERDKERFRLREKQTEKQIERASV